MNMQNLMAQAQRMQREITKKKEEIDNMEFTGKSEWVEVVYYGSKKMKSVKILKDDISDRDDLDMLEDMIKIAADDALAKVDKEYEAKMGAYANMGLF